MTRSGGDRSLLGMALLAAGTLWLLGELGLFHVAGRTLASVALVCIGAGLLVTRRTGRRRWPILVGGILALSLLGNTASANFRSEFGGGIGALKAAPVQLSQVHRTYETEFGALDLDLSRVTFPAGVSKSIQVRVGFGALHVRVPSGVAVRVKVHDSAGPVKVLGQDYGGVDVNDTYQDRSWTTESVAHLTLDVHVEAGPVNVERVSGAASVSLLPTSPTGPTAPTVPAVPSPPGSSNA